MLGSKTLLGAGWSVLARLASRIVDFVTLLVLARMLGPADFGLTAIAVSIISIVDMVLEVPLVQALTRLRDLGKAHLDTAFTLGLARGGAVAILLVGAAWPIAMIYQDERLFWLIIVLALGPIARTLYSPAMVYFYRELDFRTAFIADFSGKLVASAMSVGVLAAGGGYWAIVVNIVASSVIPTILSYVFAPYRPATSLERLSDFASFTGWFTSSQIVAALNWQYDRVFLGYHLDKASLGRYTVASDFSVLPTQTIIGPAMRPVMAAFSKISHDPVRLRTAFLKASRLTMFIAAPAGIGIALTSDLIVTIILGTQWIEAAGYLKWLALSVVLSAYYQPFYALCLATDRTKLIFTVNALDFIVKVGLTTVAFYVGGLYGMLYARALASVFLFLVSAFYARRLLGVTLFSQIGNLWQVALSCAIMSILVSMLHQALPLIDFGVVGGLLTMSVAGGLIYVGCMLAFGFRMRALI
ncbi:lipopolysaccharide biosynthesis protein [Methylobacterium sp. 77]|uniref:lipopolysaccharide biosynthesis protein n=1 Tax=Methylobacterium sp. 77 TaxID=1101192 RepID=UPI00037F7F90|nr:lipopolysaccharide biosynthesis protein [Methylobacterium sp. 77]